MKIVGKNFDQYLRIRKGSEEYREDKAKAGRIGGSLSRLSEKQAKKNGEALGLSNLRKPTKMRVLCRKDILTFEAGKMYTITMLPGAILDSPHYSFKNWVEFLEYFKRYKER